MNNDNNIPTPEGQTPNSDGTSTGQTPNSTDQTGSGTSQKTPIESLPSDAQDFIKRLIDENKSYRKRAQDQERAAQAAEQARLAEQGQFKQLAEQHETRVKELEPVAARYEALAEQIHAQIENQTKDWPAELKTLVPDKNTPVDERMARVEQLKPLLEKLQQQARSTQPGNAPGPRPAPPNGSKDVDELRTRYRESGKYGF